MDTTKKYVLGRRGQLTLVDHGKEYSQVEKDVFTDIHTITSRGRPRGHRMGRHGHGGEIMSCYPGTNRYTVTMMFHPGFLEIHK